MSSLSNWLRSFLRRLSPRKLAEDQADRAEFRAANSRFRRGVARLTPRPLRNMMERIRLDPIRERKLRLVIGYMQVMLGFLFVSLLVFFVLKAVSNIQLTEPTTATGILKESAKPERVYYTTQVIRAKKIDGANLGKEELMTVELDAPGSKYQATAVGVSQYALRVISDGKNTVLIAGNGAAQKLEPQPSVNNVIPVGPEAIEGANPKIITTEATIDGVQNWEFSFQPTPTILKKMLLTSFLKLNEPDITAIGKGEYKIIYAHAYLSRQKKQLLLTDVVFTVNGAKYRVLTQYSLYGDSRLNKLNLENPNSISSNPVTP